MTEVRSTTLAPAVGDASGEQPSAPARAEAAGSFEELVRAHYRLMYAVTRSVLRNPADAEDAAQEAVLKAYRSRETLRDPAQAQGWLARIARNCALDLGRRRTREKRLAEETIERARADGAHGETPAETPAEDEKEKLRAAIAELSEADALVVTLRFLHGLDPQEIATRTGEKAGTVRVRLHRAVKRLRDRMGGRAGTAGESDEVSA